MADAPLVTLLAFARYAELLGGERYQLPIPTPPTVAGVLAAARELPGGSALPARVLVALNARQAAPEDQVRAGDEIALLPPMAGG